MMQRLSADDVVAGGRALGYLPKAGEGVPGLRYTLNRYHVAEIYEYWGRLRANHGYELDRIEYGLLTQ